MTKKNKICIDCGVKLNQWGATRCRKCYIENKKMCEWPTRNALKRMIRHDPFLTIGKRFGVSDNAVRKWCKQYNLPFKKTEIKKYSDSEWNAI